MTILLQPNLGWFTWHGWDCGPRKIPAFYYASPSKETAWNNAFWNKGSQATAREVEGILHSRGSSPEEALHRISGKHCDDIMKREMHFDPVTLVSMGFGPTEWLWHAWHRSPSDIPEAHTEEQFWKDFALRDLVMHGGEAGYLGVVGFGDSPEGALQHLESIVNGPKLSDL